MLDFSMYLAILIVGFIWMTIAFLDTIFKSCSLHPYFTVLQATGVTIKPFTICWKTIRFNRCINRLGCYKTSYQHIWFTFGAIVTCSSLLPSFYLYSTTVWELFNSVTSEEFENAKLVPVVPGYNLPLSKWKMYMLAFLACSVFHEFGHALAASRLGVNLDNWGFNLYCFVPMSYVEVRKDQLAYCSKWEKMTIFCAGIWHNIVLSLSTFISLRYFILLVWPLFFTGRGVSVLQIHEHSMLNHPVGFVTGDHIYKVGSCSVKDVDTWKTCLDKFENVSQGLCVPDELLIEYESSVVVDECAAESPDHLYFHAKFDRAGVCLEGRRAVWDYDLCTKYSDCVEDFSCALPYLPGSQRFIVIFAYGKLEILYLGSVNELKADVLMSEFVPRSTYFSPGIAETAKEFLKYLFLFSTGLACANVLPAFKWDGIFIAETLVHICFSKLLSCEQREGLVKCISTLATGVIGSLGVVFLYKFCIFYL